MKIKILLSGRNKRPVTLPLAYQHILQAFIYNLLDDYADEVHGRSGQKYFCFSELYGKHTYDKENKELTFHGPFVMFISALDAEIIARIILSLVKKQHRFLGQGISCLDVTIVDDELVEGPYVIQTSSPITIHDSFDLDGVNKTVYYSPYDPQFEVRLNENFKRKYVAIKHPVEEDKPLSITQLSDSKEIVTKYKDFVIIGYNGTFAIDCKKEYMDFILQTGLGDRNSEGFGMVSLVKA